MNATQLPPFASKLEPVSELAKDSQPPDVVRFAYRSFDRQFIFADPRLLDRPGPSIWGVNSDKQVFMTSLLTKVLGLGPAATVTSFIPDLDHFCNRGGKDVIPLYRDSQGLSANVSDGFIDKLNHVLGGQIAPEDLFAYSYSLLSSPAYVEHFSEELIIPGPRIPITKNVKLFDKGVALGRRLIWLHTFGERFVPKGKEAETVHQGKARCIEAVPGMRKITQIHFLTMN